jgi:hypothetical protein
MIIARAPHRADAREGDRIVVQLHEVLLAQWRGLRRLTYDYLDMLEPSQLALKLPFATSQTLGYQFWCMVGAQESYTKKLDHGKWQGFSSSLDQFEEVTPAIVTQQMKKADDALAQLFKTMAPEHKLLNGQYAHEIVFQMIKHESHHHGQLINFMFCFHLPIPSRGKKSGRFHMTSRLPVY